MQIADFGTFSLFAEPTGVMVDGIDREEVNFQFDIPWDQVQGLINALAHAQRQRAEAEADGTVAAVLLQGHICAAPGDFT